MEQVLPQLPPLPQIPVEEGTETVKNTFKQINDSPKKMFGVMIGFSVVVSLLFFGFLYISQNLEVSQSKKVQEQVKDPEDTSQLDGEAYDQRRKQDLREIAQALRSYKANYGEYPASLENLVPEFLYKIPDDPFSKKQYDYRPSVSRKSFEIIARLSNGDELSQTGD